MTSQVFWKINVYGSGGHIHVEKEISIWKVTGSNSNIARKRTHWMRQPLRFEVCKLNQQKRIVPAPIHDKSVTVAGDQICFNGGFIKVYDRGLQSDLLQWDIGLAGTGAATPIETVITDNIRVVGGARTQPALDINRARAAIRTIFDGNVSVEKFCAALKFLIAFAELCRPLRDFLENLFSTFETDNCEKLFARVRNRCSDNSRRCKELLQFGLERLGECSARTPVQPTPETFHFRGENIRLEVELETAYEQGVFPLFHYEQGSKKNPTFGTLSLTEHRNPSNRTHVEATISNKSYRGDYTSIDGEHMLLFFEDRDLSPACTQNDPYFELRVDTVPLLGAKPEAVEHWFETDNTEFFIGFDPDKRAILQGSIRRLMFDPGVHCGLCPS